MRTRTRLRAGRVRARSLLRQIPTVDREDGAEPRWPTFGIKLSGRPGVDRINDVRGLDEHPAWDFEEYKRTFRTPEPPAAAA